MSCELRLVASRDANKCCRDMSPQGEICISPGREPGVEILITSQGRLQPAAGVPSLKGLDQMAMPVPAVNGGANVCRACGARSRVFDYVRPPAANSLRSA